MKGEGYRCEDGGEEHPTCKIQRGKRAGMRKDGPIGNEGGQVIDGDEEEESLERSLRANEPGQEDGACKHADDVKVEAEEENDGNGPCLNLLAAGAFEIVGHCMLLLFIREGSGGCPTDRAKSAR